MTNTVETFTPANTPKPIGPYNHIAKVGQFISIGGTAGVNPDTAQLAGPDVYSQAKQILVSFQVMLQSGGRYGVKSLFLTLGCHSSKNPFNGQASPNPI